MLDWDSKLQKKQLKELILIKNALSLEMFQLEEELLSKVY